MKRDLHTHPRSFTKRDDPNASKPAPIVTDPNGSYTGRGLDPYEKPVQDADDL